MEQKDKLVLNRIPFNVNPELQQVNLEGAILKGSALPWEPWFDFGEGKDGGILGVFLDSLAKLYNFTISVDPPEDGVWGGEPAVGKFTDDNASFQGVLKDLIDGNADFSPSTWHLGADRARWISYSWPFTDQQWLLLLSMYKVFFLLFFLFLP